MDALTQRVTLVRTEAERLQDYLGTLSPAAWHHASACAGWEVGDVVAHVTRGAEAYVMFGRLSLLVAITEGRMRM
jgi:uncharacterized protein (TIGR03083 family)